MPYKFDFVNTKNDKILEPILPHVKNRKASYLDEAIFTSKSHLKFSELCTNIKIGTVTPVPDVPLKFS